MNPIRKQSPAHLNPDRRDDPTTPDPVDFSEERRTTAECLCSAESHLVSALTDLRDGDAGYGEESRLIESAIRYLDALRQVRTGGRQ